MRIKKKSDRNIASMHKFSDNKPKNRLPSEDNEKKGWFSDLEILEIHQKINNEQDTNTISDTPIIDKQEQSNRNKLPISENRNTTHPNSTEQTLTQKQKINLKNVKKIMNGKKTTQPSLRNIECRIVKTENPKKIKH